MASESAHYSLYCFEQKQKMNRNEFTNQIWVDSWTNKNNTAVYMEYYTRYPIDGQILHFLRHAICTIVSHLCSRNEIVYMAKAFNWVVQTFTKIKSRMSFLAF